MNTKFTEVCFVLLFFVCFSCQILTKAAKMSSFSCTLFLAQWSLLAFYMREALGLFQSITMTQSDLEHDVALGDGPHRPWGVWRQQRRRMSTDGNYDDCYRVCMSGCHSCWLASVSLAWSNSAGSVAAAWLMSSGQSAPPQRLRRHLKELCAP